MKTILVRMSAIAALAAGLACGSGCATTAMKGTPFFSGEYQKSKGPAEDRVNIWPLLYYREPALSVIWPIYEHVADEHLAVRPLFSIYNMNDERKRELNILWPFYQTDHAAGTGRAIPFFWGDDYVVGFPLYWRFSDAKDDFVDVMIPLWWYERDALFYKFYTLLGLAGWEHSKEADGWRIFPLVGNYDYRNGGHYRFLLWPLGHDYANASGGEKFSMLFPLYGWSRNDRGSTFVSLPWSQGSKKNGDSWRMAFPFFFQKGGVDSSAFYTLLGGYASSPDSSSWLSPLLLSGGSRSTSASNTWLLAGLAHWGGEAGRSSSHVVPLYYSSSDRTGSRFYSLPWSSKRDAKDGSWQLAPPFYFHSENADRSRTITPLYAAGKSTKEQSDWNTVIPLWYAQHDRDGDFLATLLGGHRSGTDGDSWMIYPLLTWNAQHGTTNDFWALAPLLHFRSAPGGGGSHVVPLYYNDNESGTFLSLPYARWTNSDHRETRVIPPLLSWQNTSPHKTDTWIAGGLSRISTGEKSGPSYAIPFYYGNPQSGTHLSPVYCSWRDSDGETMLIPPLLGALSAGKDGSKEVWALLGLYAHAWNKQGTLSDHLLPLYAYAPSNYFYTIIAGWRTGSDAFAYYCTPLIGSSSDANEKSFWFFPFFNRSVSKSNGDTHGHILWATFRNAKERSHSTFFPFYGYENHGPITDPKPGNPYEIQGTDFLCLPYCWRTDLRRITTTGGHGHETTSVVDEYSHGAFPLWSYSRKTDPARGTITKSSVLLALYDSKHETGPDPKAPGGLHDYRRNRVLWHAWHYEKLNGDVSVDMLPAITYDARTDGFRSYSFLWRLYRWQRDAEGRRKLDLLFLPLIRDK